MAIGSGSEGAQTALQEHYKDDLTLAEAEVLALNTLKQVMEEKVSNMYSHLGCSVLLRMLAVNAYWCPQAKVGMDRVCTCMCAEPTDPQPTAHRVICVSRVATAAQGDTCSS